MTSLTPAWTIRPGGARAPLRRLAVRCAALALATTLSAAPALALSEVKQEDVPPQPEVTSEPLPPPDTTLETAPADPDAAPEGEDETVPSVDPSVPLPDILYDTSLLPAPVRDTRDRIIAACVAGDIEALRPLIGTGQARTQLSFGVVDGDPIDFLRGISGDEEGHEILAILEEVMEAGYVHLDAGTPQELYVWPYFFAVPLDSLSAPQRVELFKLVTAGDFKDMQAFGAYIFYRVGITPEGQWVFFVAGD